MNVLTFIYFSHTRHVSTENVGHSQATLQHYKGKTEEELITADFWFYMWRYI
jgi:hypothetical protein